MERNKFKYNWTLKDAVFTKDKGTVFSCFSCGGGSTMGYKLAGFDVIGCNEIDPKMMEAYKANHNPKYAYLEPIQTFKLRDDLPKELYELDILDGSPPCSSFSMAGNRDKDWGKKKKFKEGQAKQVLDTLFFDFIDLAKKLQPKVVVAENVKGILLGNAINYVREIYREFDLAGYYVQHFLLDASTMGVPQRRERVFFIAMRKDLATPFLQQKDMFTLMPKLDLVFKEKKIPFKSVRTFGIYERKLSPAYQLAWDNRKLGDRDMSDTMGREFNRPNSFFNYKYLYNDNVINTITAADNNVVFDEPRYMNTIELCHCGTFPEDYDFLKNKPYYFIGMSVPPVMVAKIAEQISIQWLEKLKKND